MSIKKDRDKKLREMTREAIRNAVLNVMEDHGQDGITMQRVADEAGLAKGTLYLYFDNKDDLLEDTIDWCFAPLIDGIEKIFAADLQPDKKIGRLAEFHHQFFRDHQKLFRMLFVDLQITHSEKNNQENEHYKNILQKSSALIREGIGQGIFRDINPMAVAIMMMESSMELNYQFLKTNSNCDFGVSTPADILKDVYLKGILEQ
jgi:AcrR family transcriptional regulator